LHVGSLKKVLLVSFACSRSYGQAVLVAFPRRETALTERFVRKMHPTCKVFLRAKSVCSPERKEKAHGLTAFPARHKLLF
jgi:hypothetical protein